MATQRRNVSTIARVNASKVLLLGVLLRLDVSAEACLFLAGRLLELLILPLDELVLHPDLVLPSHPSMLFEIANAELDILLLLTEAERCGYLIVIVDLLLVEDEHVVASDDVAGWVNQVSSSIDHTAKLIIQFTIHSLQDYSVAVFVRLKLT